MSDATCWPGTNILRRDVQLLSAMEETTQPLAAPAPAPVELLSRALGITRAAIRRCEREYYAALRHHSPSLAGAALVHANEAKIHKDRVGARIAGLGGSSEASDANADDGATATLVPRAAPLATLIDQDVAADRAASASLREIQQCFVADPTTHALLEEIIAGIDERAGNLEELLERRPAA